MALLPLCSAVSQRFQQEPFLLPALFRLVAAAQRRTAGESQSQASEQSGASQNGGNSGNSGNGEEPKPDLAKEESEKSEKSEKPVPAMVETVEPENHRIEIKLPGSSSNTPEAGEDSELPAEEETEEAEESEEAEEVLIPYDISLLHQILSFLIQLADPTKCV